MLGNEIDISQPQEICNALLRRVSRNIPVSFISEDDVSQVTSFQLSILTDSFITVWATARSISGRLRMSFCWITSRKRKKKLRLKLVLQGLILLFQVFQKNYFRL